MCKNRIIRVTRTEFGIDRLICTRIHLQPNPPDCFMPLMVFHHILNRRGHILVWDGTESLQELRHRFKEAFPQGTIPIIKLAKREREFIIGRLLLHLILPDQILSVLPNGKPVVNGGWHVSFSHSLNLVGLVVADVPVGLDIQVPDEKISRIKSKFCGIQELQWIKSLSDQLAGATVIWSAKEAVFKVFGHDVDFAQDMKAILESPDQEFFQLAYSGQHGSCLFEMTQIGIREARLVYTALLDQSIEGNI